MSTTDTTEPQADEMILDQGGPREERQSDGQKDAAAPDMPVNQDDGYFSGPLRVDTVSLQRTGESLLVVIDGEEVVLPGGKASVMVDDSGRTRVDVFATFAASEVDITNPDTDG